MMADVFCLPEVCLLSDIVTHLEVHGAPFNPASVYADVSSVVSMLHKSGRMHREVMQNFPRYMKPAPKLSVLLKKLRASGRKLFLLTNSGYAYVNASMAYLMGGAAEKSDWKDFFDVIVVDAIKPLLFSSTRPFRRLDLTTERPAWDHIGTLERGQVYVQGGLSHFQHLTHWKSSNVVYFGDHIKSDIMEARALVNWRTGFILRELRDEVALQNSPRYRCTLSKLSLLERLLEDAQLCLKPELAVLVKWRLLRAQIRQALHCFLNPYFGSAFRTSVGSTLFSHMTTRYADIYTSSIENFLSLPLSENEIVLYPKLSSLPHEPKLPL